MGESEDNIHRSW